MDWDPYCIFDGIVDIMSECFTQTFEQSPVPCKGLATELKVALVEAVKGDSAEAESSGDDIVALFLLKVGFTALLEMSLDETDPFRTFFGV